MRVFALMDSVKPRTSIKLDRGAQEHADVEGLVEDGAIKSPIHLAPVRREDSRRLPAFWDLVLGSLLGEYLKVDAFGVQAFAIGARRLHNPA